MVRALYVWFAERSKSDLALADRATRLRADAVPRRGSHRSARSLAGLGVGLRRRYSAGRPVRAPQYPIVPHIVRDR